MEKPDYTKMMNEKPLVPMTKEMDLKPGTLIGFRGFSGKEEKVSAGYPLWSKRGDQIQFVLCIAQETGRPIIDNTRLVGEDIFINTEPIIVDVDPKNPQSFNDRLTSFFPGKT